MNESVKNLPFHFESSTMLKAPAGTVFSHLDDHRRLSEHMSQSSWMIAGAQMKIEMDAAQGHAVGSRIRLVGRVLGILLSVEEIVTDYAPPLRKSWLTTDEPKLLVIGRYRMGFEITPQGNASQLRIFIDYALPDSMPARWLGRMFGNWYARWCTLRMIGDAGKYF
ncbi:MAG: SRPBCC family protein [Gallionella sp.]